MLMRNISIVYVLTYENTVEVMGILETCIQHEYRICFENYGMLWMPYHFWKHGICCENFENLNLD